MAKARAVDASGPRGCATSIAPTSGRNNVKIVIAMRTTNITGSNQTRDTRVTKAAPPAEPTKAAVAIGASSFRSIGILRA